ncbi:hypothetical protein [Paenibacillus sp. sgz302251]|uniref:hypothetical protein n=1 Tax=Paenibacillus sp. sgz302251 TaxID=3414493 RepID=UPI003C7C521C
MYEFEVFKQRDGLMHKFDAFNGQVRVSLPYDTTLLEGEWVTAVFRFVPELGEWEYVGGTKEGEKISFLGW